MPKNTDMTSWSKLFSDLFTNPLETMGDVGGIMARNFMEHWWEILLLLLGFWLLRVIVFSIVDVIVPRSLSEKPPRWARSKAFLAIRGRMYNQSLESRSLYRTRAVVGLTKSFLDPIMFFVAFATAFGKLGIRFEQGTITVIIGAFSVAVAFGAQGVVKDILAGITVLVSDAYAVGDYIDVQFGAAGIVKKIGLRLTELEASDGTIWFVRHSDVPKVGNRTAARSMVVSDVTLTWNDEEKEVRVADLKFVETRLDNTIRDLAETLESVDRIARDKAPALEDKEVTIKDIAAVVPDLVPTVSAETLWNLKDRGDGLSSDDTGVHRIVKRIPGRVPVFTRIETLGLVNSTRNSVTLRLRIVLPPSASRSQGMAVLRRAVFEAFADDGITPQFDDAPESSLVFTASERELTP